MARSPWSSLDPTRREAAADGVARLLHDWIKAMEMWLSSVDWSDPPADAPALIDRAIRQTRRSIRGSRGAREMWEAARQELAGLGGDGWAEWAAGLDAELAALEALLGLDDAGLRTLGAHAIEARVRAPGKRLREARVELAGSETR